jgi:wobble nucleotide-excising tRNase
MKRYTHFRSAAVFAFVASMLAVSTQCASSPNPKATVDSMGTFGNETAKAKDSIDKAVKSLESLEASQPGEVNVRFASYSKSVKALEEQSSVIRGQAEKMKAAGDAFFKEWEAEKVVDPSRRDQLAASYAKIKEDMTQAREKFTPFLASLKDIESYLSLDPSTKAIASMSELVKKANATGADLNSRIDGVLTELNSVRGMLSTKTN